MIRGRKPAGVGTLTGGGMDVVVVKTVDVSVATLVQVVALGVTVMVSRVVVVMRMVLVVSENWYHVGTGVLAERYPNRVVQRVKAEVLADCARTEGAAVKRAAKRTEVNMVELERALEAEANIVAQWVLDEDGLVSLYEILSIMRLGEAKG